MADESNKKRDPKDWPELQNARLPQQTIAEAMVRKEAEEAHKLLIKRMGVLKLVVAVALLSAGQALVGILPQLWGSGSFDAVATTLASFNAALQLASVGYLVAARDPDFAALVIKILLIFNGLELFMGFALASSLPLTIINVGLLYLAYTKLQSLRKMWF